MIQVLITFISGVFSVGIYFLFLSLLVYYFNTKMKDKSLHFVDKKETSIEVFLASPPPKEKKIIKKEIIKPTLPKQIKPKKVVKKVVKKVIKKPITKKTIAKKTTPKKVKTKKIIKEKVVKKTTSKKKPIKKVVKRVKSQNKPSKKKNTTKELFDNVKTKKPTKQNDINSLFGDYKPKSSSRDEGIKKAYFAKVERSLRDWPAQTDFAGERAMVWIRVEPNGKFRFRLKRPSGNYEFNRGLIAYLRQLQQTGFGKHKGNRAYELDVEFVAID